MNSKHSFTLIELLVVIAIIGILAGVIVISMTNATDRANIAKSQIFANSVRDTLGASLVSEWRFDGTAADGSTATASDVLDTWGTNNGAITTQPIVKTGSSCVSGSCLQFDGVDDFVNFGNNPSLSMGTGDATVSLWVKFDNATAPMFETLIGCGGANTGQDGYWVYRHSGMSRLGCAFSDGTATYLGTYLSASGTLVSNTWYNIVVTFDRDSVAQAYINGVKQVGTVAISTQQGDVQNAKSLAIGSWTGTAHFFAGKEDEVRIYNAIMPTSQIKQQYYAGVKKLLANNEITREEYNQRIAELENYSVHP